MKSDKPRDGGLFGTLIDGLTDAAEATVKGAISLPGKLVRGAVEGAEDAADAVMDAMEGKK